MEEVYKIEDHLTPMMRQYLEIKKQNEDAFLFYRLGDFYEMFFDDAKKASKLLDLVLTGKDCGLPERAPMCGIPYHSAEGYINKLISLGYKVAVCEQTEDPALAKGLVKREIVRKVTPGTVIDSEALEEKENNFIVSVYTDGTKAGIAFADVSSGEFKSTFLESDNLAEQIIDELAANNPKEAVLGGEAENLGALTSYLRESNVFFHTEKNEKTADEYQQLLSAQANGALPLQLDKSGKTETVMSAGILLSYLIETVMCDLSHMTRLEFYIKTRYMDLPKQTRHCLELTETMASRSRKGSLLGVIDLTKTAMGGRMLRSWLERPLCMLPELLRRQNAVAELSADTVARSEIRELLSGVYDLERLMSQIIYGSANAKTLVALASTAKRLPDVRKQLEHRRSEELNSIYAELDDLADLCSLIDEAITDDPPFVIREGKMIKRGYNAELDNLIYVSENGKQLISELEAREREKTGFKNLKVGFNRVFGYYIEISKAFTGAIPEDYVRKQTISNCERYVTAELKELETTILQADDRICTLEYELFCDVRDRVKSESVRIMRTASAIARLDTLASLAEVAVLRGYTRPEVDMSGEIVIRDGRHPVVEAMGLETVFIPNDTVLDKNENRLAIITGPNMAGKSTYMRQVALIVILAQIGSFVPAASAKIGIVDKIFTRIGAGDELAAGKSTFMVEMSETALILASATPDSLIIFDEIGRGTSTFDGMSIARAVLEYVASKKTLGAKTMFATHYHELTSLESKIDGVKNYNITAKKRGDELIFLRKIVRGGADDSYGIEVGKLAGLPKQVIAKAKTILEELESGKRETVRTVTVSSNEGQQDLSGGQREELLKELASLKVDTMTPLEALNVLYRLSREAAELI